MAASGTRRGAANEFIAWQRRQDLFYPLVMVIRTVCRQQAAWQAKSISISPWR